MTFEILQTAVAVCAGCLAGCLVACVPSLHIYNVIGLATIGQLSVGGASIGVPAPLLVPLMVGLLVGWSMGNTIPSVLIAAPDESALLTVMPGQKYALMGRGFEAVMLTAFGGLAGAFILVAIVGPLAPVLMPTLHAVFGRHTHWVLWAVIVFMLMSEWPKRGNRGQGGWRKFLQAWTPLSAGILTFCLSGLLGFILHYRSPIRAESAFLGMMPVFVGLFAMPWLILNIVSRVELPSQAVCSFGGVPGWPGLGGVCAGFLGGVFASYFPGISGGIGGMLAGHAASQRDSRMFLVSQGTSKVVYYVGAFLFFFIPGESHARGTATWMLRGCHVPLDRNEYCVVLASIAIAAAVAFALMQPLARLVLRAVELFGCRRISMLSAVLMVAIVSVGTGWRGLLILPVATGIGLVPVLFHSRRLNCLGVILLPMACSMSGMAPAVAGGLGLL
ncbi:MAG: tripartite tricarboxylate transporter permease [bacterium]